MNCLALAFLAVAVLGADQNLAPPMRLDSGGEIELAKVLCDGKSLDLSPDGERLVAVVKDASGYNLAAWEIQSKSKMVLAKGAPAAYLSVSPDGRSLLGCIGVKRDEDLWHSDGDYSIWEVASKSRTAITRLNLGFVLASPAFSRDGTLLAIADGNTNKLHLWKRDAAAKWNRMSALDLGQQPDAGKCYRIAAFFTPDDKHVVVLSLFVGQGSEVGPFVVEKWEMSGPRRLDFPVKAIWPEIMWGGQFFFVAGEKTFCIQGAGPDAGAVGIDVSSGKRKYIAPVLLTGASVSPDGRTGAAVAVDWARDSVNEPSDALVQLWNFDDGTRLRHVKVQAGKVPGGEAVGGDERPFGIFSADSRFFVLAPGDAAHHIHVIDVNKPGARSTLKMGEHAVEIEKAAVTSSFTVDAPIKGLFLLNSGEIAAVGVEPNAILIWRIKTP